MRTAQRISGPALALVACGLIVALLHLSRGIDYRAIMRALHETPRELVWLAVLFTGISFLALIARELCALTHAGLRVPPPVLLLASFCGSALGNAVGFGKLTGAAVRSRVYGVVGFGAEQIRRITLLINVMFGIGLAAFMAASAMLAGSAAQQILGVSPIALHLGGAAALIAIVGSLLAAARRGTSIAIGDVSLAPPTVRIALVQLMLTALDIAAAGVALWLLLPVAPASVPVALTPVPMSAGRVDFFTFATAA